MEENKSGKKSNAKLIALSQNAFAFLTRWFFMISLLAALAFCVFVWYSFVWNAEWNPAKKQAYVSEQAKFSFDKSGYKKMIELMNIRNDKFQNFPSFAGRDIFFPDGF
ncbi:MAG TPA: hypothetical protein VK254_01045 [Candidatus Bathyarchaeia archaeon]|nr:hypothetical protein [Candidatus Bathyarchaeia archaeon]